MANLRLPSRLACCLCLASAATIAVGPVYARPMAVPLAGQEAGKQADKPIDLDLRGVTVRDALRQALSGTTFKLDVDRNAEPLLDGNVTLRLTGQPVRSALRLIARAASKPFRFEIDGNTVRVRLLALGADGLPVKKVTLEYRRWSSISLVLDELFSDTGVEYVIGKAEADTPIQVVVKDKPFPEALGAVLRAARMPLAFTPVGPTLVSIQRVQPPAVPIQGDAAGSGLTDRPVTLDLKATPIRQALEQVFAQAVCDYSIDPRVAGTVTLSVKDAPFNTVLPRILAQGDQRLTYRVESNVIIVKPAP